MLINTACESSAEEKWFVSLYGGISSIDTFYDFFKINSEYENSYILVATAGRRLAHIKESLAFEVEGQIVQHFGLQHHQEFNILAMARLLKLPWNHILKTSLAAGEGISYATKLPNIENDDPKDDHSKVLNYLMVEAAFTVKSKPVIESFVRIHHRSGIFGLINGVKREGSNFLCTGVRYYF